jgi:hypothetical protein
MSMSGRRRRMGCAVEEMNVAWWENCEWVPSTLGVR